MSFIPGMCRLWARKTQGPDTHWFDMPYAQRGYAECERLVEYYEEAFGNFYVYEIRSAADNYRRCY